MNRYWLKVAGEITGPFSEEELKQLTPSGRLPERAEICPIGYEDWKPGNEVLFPPVAPAPRAVREPSAEAVPANAWVCTRCHQWSWGTTESPSIFSGVSVGRRGLRFFGGSRRRARPKIVCAACGAGSIVPAGSPRGQKLLAAQGLGVGAEKMQFGCAHLLLLLLGVFILIALVRACAVSGK